MSGPRLIVYDDAFPDLRSGFRLAEFTGYLDAFPDALVAVAGASTEAFEARRDAWLAMRPDHAGRIVPMTAEVLEPRPALLYAIFLNNAHDLVSWAESSEVPFAFQLYPGGGFAFDEPGSDARLARVLASPMLSFVVVTQPAVRAYVLDRFDLAPERVHLIGPGPVWSAGAGERHARREDEPFEVGFVAHKYSGDLRGKGYDFFVALAAALASREPRARFHVVGNWEPADVPLGDLAARFTFHGLLDAPALDRVCRSLDVLVSPNVPATLARGGFDGFPLASSSQAALAGAVVFATDPLGLNTALEPGSDFVLLERALDATRPEDVERAAATLHALASDPARLAGLSESGRRAFQRLVGPEAQVAPRVALVRKALSGAFPPLDGDPARWRAAASAAAHEDLRSRAELARLNGVIQDAARYIAQKERNIAELSEVTRRVQRALDEASRYIAQRDQVVAELVGQVERLDAELRKAADYIAQKERNIAELVENAHRLEAALRRGP